MAAVVKKNVGDEAFDKWMRDQLRMVGEELIRRSENMDFRGWDMVTDISVHVTIPTYTDRCQVPDIEFRFSTLNKTVLDDFVKAGIGGVLDES